jgi:hypothetical protein
VNEGWPPRVALLTIGDGRDECLRDTLASFAAHVTGFALVEHVHVDDRDHRLGFGGAIREGWRRLRELDGFDYIWHLEEDFTTLRPIDLGALALILELQPEVVQVALRREPVNDPERRAGGVVEMWPDAYADRCLPRAFAWGDPYGLRPYRLAWLEHELYFTTNPSLYRRELIDDHDWLDVPGSERAMTMRLLTAGARFALWGDRDDAPLARHTGERQGKGY